MNSITELLLKDKNLSDKFKKFIKELEKNNGTK